MTFAKLDNLFQLRLHALQFFYCLLKKQTKGVCNVCFVSPWTLKLTIPAVRYLLYNATGVSWEVCNNSQRFSSNVLKFCIRCRTASVRTPALISHNAQRHVCLVLGLPRLQGTSSADFLFLLGKKFPSTKLSQRDPPRQKQHRAIGGSGVWKLYRRRLSYWRKEKL